MGTIARAKARLVATAGHQEIIAGHNGLQVIVTKEDMDESRQKKKLPNNPIDGKSWAEAAKNEDYNWHYKQARLHAETAIEVKSKAWRTDPVVQKAKEKHLKDKGNGNAFNKGYKEVEKVFEGTEAGKLWQTHMDWASRHRYTYAKLSRAAAEKKR